MFRGRVSGVWGMVHVVREGRWGTWVGGECG